MQIKPLNFKVHGHKLKACSRLLLLLLAVLDKWSRGHQHILEHLPGNIKCGLDFYKLQQSVLSQCTEHTDKPVSMAIQRACRLAQFNVKSYLCWFTTMIKCIYGLYCMCPMTIVQEHFGLWAGVYFYHTLQHPHHIHEVWNHLNLKKLHFLQEHIHTLPVSTV